MACDRIMACNLWHVIRSCAYLFIIYLLLFLILEFNERNFKSLIEKIDIPAPHMD